MDITHRIYWNSDMHFKLTPANQSTMRQSSSTPWSVNIPKVQLQITKRWWYWGPASLHCELVTSWQPSTSNRYHQMGIKKILERLSLLHSRDPDLVQLVSQNKQAPKNCLVDQIFNVIRKYKTKHGFHSTANTSSSLHEKWQLNKISTMNKTVCANNQVT